MLERKRDKVTKPVKNIQGFTFVLKTNIKLRLPDKTFWLPDNINVKTYSKTLGCPVGQPGVNF